MRCLVWLLLLTGQAREEAPKVPASHPRILFTAADLPALRLRMKEDDGWRAVEGYVQRLAIDPKTPFENSSLQIRCHMLSEAAATLTFHALLSNDATKANAFFEAFDPSEMESKLPKNEFMPRGEFLYGLAIAYDWGHPVLSAKARENLGAIVRRNATENYQGMANNKSWEATVEANNHSMAAMGGVGLAGFALWGDEKNAPAWVDLASRKVKAYVEQSFDEDGACYEGNLYGPFGLNMALAFTATLKNLGGPDRFGDGRLVRAIHWMVGDLLPGNQKMVPLNDASGGTIPGNITLYGATACRDGLSRWAWDLNPGGTWTPYRMLWTDPVKAVAPDFKVRRYRGRGLVTMRSGFESADVFASFECGARRKGCHGQADQAQFTLYGGGGDFIVDTHYSNKGEEGTANQTVGHNLVLIDGKGQALSGGGQVVEGKTVSYVSDDTITAVVGDMAGAYGERGYNAVQKAVRSFLWVRSSKKPYLVVVDEVIKGASTNKYESLLHTAPENKVTWGKNEATIAAAGGSLNVRYFTPLKIATATRQMSFKESSLGDHPALVASIDGRAWFCVTLLSFDEPEVTFAGEVKEGRVRITVKRADDEDVIAIAPRFDKSPSPVDFTRSSGGKQTYKKKPF